MLWHLGSGSVFEDSSAGLRHTAGRVAATMDAVAAGRRDVAATLSARAAQLPEDRERLSGLAAEFISSAERAEAFAADERSKARGYRSTPS